MFGDETVQHGHQVVGGEGTLDLDDQALAGEDVLDVEELELFALTGLAELEVHRPDGVRSNGAHGPDVNAQSAKGLLALAIRDLKAL